MNDLINKKYKNIELISTKDFSINQKSFNEFYKDLNISWMNPRITDFDYPFKEEFMGKWEIQVLRNSKKMNFEDIVKLCKEDGYQPANIYHMLNFTNSIKDLNNYRSFMAPGALCVDDFEYPGCVVLSNEKNNGISLGLGNWRGNKIGGYDILRVKKYNQGSSQSIKVV